MKLFCEEEYCPACSDEAGPSGCVAQCFGSGVDEPSVCDEFRIELRRCEVVNDLCFVAASQHERDEDSPCYWESVDVLDCANTYTR